MDDMDKLMASALFMAIVAVSLLSFGAGFLLGVFL